MPARAGVAAALLAPLLLGGCGGGSGSSEACPTGGGNGMLAVNISGNTPGAVSVEGASAVVQVNSVVTLPAGPHRVTANPVAVPQPNVASLAFAGTVDVQDACVRAGATTTVNATYALIPTSGKLWTGVGDAPGGSTMLGFAPASVLTSGDASADVAANTGGSDGFTFDRDGNMWIIGGTSADPPLARYPASMFAADGDKTPDVVINSASFGDAIPGPLAVAFDPSGNLWVSVVTAGKIVMFTAGQIAVSSTAAATVERSGFMTPQGIAFDGAGNLWVASEDDEAVVRIDAGHLTASGTGGDLGITALSSGPSGGTLRPISLAFDTAGNLWVNYDGTIARITPAEQGGTGSKTITPGVQITTDVLTLPIGIAFDQDGGLWLAHAAGKFARFDPSQLSGSGSVAPSTLISSPDVGYAAWFAIYPAPPGTPLYHKVP